MEKIPSLFDANLDPRSECDWVWENNSKATVQFDGRCYAIIDGVPYRHVVSADPPEIVNCIYEDQWWGWERVPDSDTDFWDMWTTTYASEHWDWTYELVGPGVNGNHEGSTRHVLVPHGREIIFELNCPTFDHIKEYLARHPVEGIVFWEDPWDLYCRKAKVQQTDFKYYRSKRKPIG